MKGIIKEYNKKLFFFKVVTQIFLINKNVGGKFVINIAVSCIKINKRYNVSKQKKLLLLLKISLHDSIYGLPSVALLLFVVKHDFRTGHVFYSSVE